MDNERTRRRAGAIAVFALLAVNLVLFGLIAARNTTASPGPVVSPNSVSPEASPEGDSSLEDVEDPTPTATETANPTATETANKSQTKVELRFSDGTYRVGGDEVKPGATYVTVKAVQDACFVRVVAKNGEFLVEKNVNARKRATVAVPIEGFTFSSSGCGIWKTKG